eukprot:TRINITY_DN5536_c0_g1_i1.p1 TRINITY_DN5536_c0_g1~~TRINITY_DN5536_c0_g1_i1.p1  ORF type:complete len:331 (-),score=45.65 TRINITY_DN5536_c0_g1_i1:226-1218(-)
MGLALKSNLSPALLGSKIALPSQPLLRTRTVGFLHRSGKVNSDPLPCRGFLKVASSWGFKERSHVTLDFNRRCVSTTAKNNVCETEPEMKDSDFLSGHMVTSVNGKDISNKTKECGLQPFKWPLWILGSSLLLITGAFPMLWLPLSSIFSGSSIVSFLTLAGLDGIFNVGAIFFLLIADYCARSKTGNAAVYRIPFSYKFWNIFLNLLGFTVPCLVIAASYKDLILPNTSFFTFLSILGPYLMLIIVQVLAEALTWHWNSPTWLIVPVVYEAYRFLQLIRGRDLGVEIGAPLWLIDGMKGLIAWWAFVFGLQLIKIAWFIGHGQLREQES